MFVVVPAGDTFCLCLPPQRQKKVKQLVTRKRLLTSHLPKVIAKRSQRKIKPVLKKRRNLTETKVRIRMKKRRHVRRRRNRSEQGHVPRTDTGQNKSPGKKEGGNTITCHHKALTSPCPPDLSTTPVEMVNQTQTETLLPKS